MAVSRKSKSKRSPTMIRAVLARNVVALRDQVFRDLSTVTARNEKLAREIKSTLAQVQRICKGELGTSIDTVEWLAEALRVRPHDLLTPYFATGVHPPQSDRTSAADQAELQRRPARAPLNPRP